MVLKWFETDISNEIRENNQNETVHKFLHTDIVQTQLLVLDDCVKKIMESEDNSRIEFLKGYLYNSPSHEGIICWRALAEAHNLENVKHLLSSIDHEPNTVPSPNYPIFNEAKNSNYLKNFFDSNPLDNKSLSESSDSGIYEGCYNGHHEKTTQEIRRVLSKIYKDLLKIKSDKNIKKNDFKPINSHEAKLISEYEKITSKMSPSPKNISDRTSSINSSLDEEGTENFNNDKQVKVDYPESSDYEASLKKLEKQSMNKMEDELVSDCEIFLDNKKSPTRSSSISPNYVRPSKPEVKKVVPPRRKRHRIHSYLDKELSSSEEYNSTKNPNIRRNRLRDSKQKSAFKKVENKYNEIEKELPKNEGLWAQQVSEKKNEENEFRVRYEKNEANRLKENKPSQVNEKTDEELISEFERFSPRKSHLLTDKKSKYEEVYNDLNISPNRTLKTKPSYNNYVDFNSIKNNDESENKFLTKNENNENGPKINYQRPNSPVKLNNHILTLYPVQVASKQGTNQQTMPIVEGRGPPLGYIGSPNMAKPKLYGVPENKPKFEVNATINDYINQANRKFQYKNDQATNPPVQPKFKFLHKFSNKFIKKVNSVKNK